MATLKRAIVLAALAAVVAVVGTACDDDNGAQSENSTQQADVDTISARVQRNEMMFAIITLGNLGLHDIDETLNDTGVVDPEFAPSARAAVRLLALTDWAPDVQARADAAREEGVTLLKALEDEDVEAARPAATALHEEAHELDEEVWAILAADLAPDEGGVEEHEDEPTPAADGTPASEGTEEAEETPAAGATP
jgi:hypothetical protein